LYVFKTSSFHIDFTYTLSACFKLFWRCPLYLEISNPIPDKLIKSILMHYIYVTSLSK